MASQPKYNPTRGMSESTIDYYNQWLPNSPYAGTPHATDTSWLSKPYIQMSPEQAAILRDPGVIGTSGWSPKPSELPMVKWQNQLTRAGVLTPEGTWDPKAPKEYSAAMHAANMDPSGVNVGARSVNNPPTKTSSSSSTKQEIVVTANQNLVKAAENLATGIEKAAPVIQKAADATAVVANVSKSIQNASLNQIAGPGAPSPASPHLSGTATTTSSRTVQGFNNFQAQAVHSMKNLPQDYQHIPHTTGMKKEPSLDRTGTRIGDFGRFHDMAVHSMKNLQEEYQHFPHTRNLDPLQANARRLQSAIAYESYTPNAPFVPKTTITSASPNTGGYFKPRFTNSFIPSKSPHDTTSGFVPGRHGYVMEDGYSNLNPRPTPSVHQDRQVVADAKASLERSTLRAMSLRNQETINEFAYQQRLAAGITPKLGYTPSVPVAYEPPPISSARMASEGAAYASMGGGGPLGHYTPPPPPPTPPPPQVPSGRYNRPFIPGTNAAKDYYNTNIAPNLQSARKRMVHHAGSAAVWGATGMVIGGTAGMLQASAGKYAESFDASMQQLIGVGFTEPMRAYARQRIIETASTNPHIDPAKMANSVYELASGMSVTAENLPSIMSQAERFQTYALTYAQDPAKTSLEIGKMTNMLKNHPSYKGLTKEQAYERTFFHIAPLVESELFHGKDLMTASQYFMNPAMNMMGWSPGQAFAMSGILQSAGIAPSSTGTALRQGIDENVYKGMARTQFLAEQVNAHRAAGKGHPLIASGAQDRFFTSKKMGGEWGLVTDPTTGAKISPRQRLDQIKRGLMQDTSAEAFLNNIERQRRQTEVLGGPEYGYSPQQLGISQTFIPTLYSMTPERVKEIKDAGQRADNVTLSEEEQKRRIEQRKSSEAPGSVYSKFEQAFTGWLNSPGNVLGKGLNKGASLLEGWSKDNAVLDHYSRSVNSKDAHTRKEHAFFYQETIRQDAHKYVRENHPDATGLEKEKLVKEREDYLNKFYTMKSTYKDSAISVVAGTVIPGFNYFIADPLISTAAKVQQATDKWYSSGSAGSPKSVDAIPSSYSTYFQNYNRYAASGMSPSVSSLNTLSQSVFSTLPLAGFMPNYGNLTDGYPQTPTVNISIGNTAVDNHVETVTTKNINRKDDEVKATNNNTSSSSTPIDTSYSDLPTIGGFKF